MRVIPGSLSEVTRALDDGAIRCTCGGGALRRWGWARSRLVRRGDRRLRFRPRRGRCDACGRTHVLLPDVCLSRRLDAVQSIGAALTASASGRGARRTAAALGVPASTVRGWLAAFRARGSPLPPGWREPGFRWDSVTVGSDGSFLAPIR